jgi:hypothetical protein
VTCYACPVLSRLRKRVKVIETQMNKSTCYWIGALLFLGIASSALATSIARNECTSPPPGTVFCEDFEGSNPKGNFDDHDGNPDTENQVVLDTGPSGDAENKAIRLRVPPGQRGTSDLLKVLPGKYDKLYARWYFKYEPGFNFAAPNHGGGLAIGDRHFLNTSGQRPNGDDFAGFYFQYLGDGALPFAYSYYRGMYQDCLNAKGSCWGDSLPCVYDSGKAYCTKPQHRPTAPLPALQASQWYCIEELVEMGTPTSAGTPANGRLALWLDMQLLGDYRDLWVRTTASLRIEMLYLSLFHHDGTHSIAGELIDNVVVSTQRVGCGTTPIPLSLPTNQRVLTR